MMRKSKAKEAYALPTPELTAKSVMREEAMSPSPGSPKRLRRLDANELDRLLYAGHLSPDQHSTLELFKKDLERAGMIFMPKASLVPSSTSGHAQFISDNAFRRARLVSEQIGVLKAALPKQADLILAALMEDRRLEGAGLVAARVAAAALEPLYRRG